MTPLRLLAVSALAVALSSCGNHGGDSAYETSNPYGAPQGGGQAAAAGAPAQASNPTYDTPAAYEETTGTAAAPAPDSSVVDPGMTAPRSTASPSHASAPKPSASKPAAAAVGGTTHVVVKGDTLGGIAKKYGVSQKAIMTANGMTKDVVVLGKTLQIPAH
ncbi:LysM peptidoglycan-binding domain-containing protein [Luteolibacter sp. LG18]|uniref:LysM peptidoglycan-binding domain-containing protein n=1 Tax=Luteolibacter sp. LG18 TaxID=2819286 RepID=UPI002B2F7C03|nr:hypothetical protein llg_05360 [Luteolibacter sp. LG18]